MDVLNQRDDLSRERVWLSAWIQIAASSNCTKKDVPAAWADQCLADFDKRFPVTVESDP